MPAGKIDRVIIIVLDSAGAGAMPDARLFGDDGADTIGHVLEAHPDITLPNMAALGLGNALSLLKPRPIKPVASPLASFGLMLEASPGKDTTTGHWELMGLLLQKPFKVFHDGFPAEIVNRFVAETGREVLGNKPASGTAIIEELGPEQKKTGKWILYTSADSVFQIAAHEDVIPLSELYDACEKARRMLDPYFVSRVIARPFIGKPGSYKRTYNRRDFSIMPESDTVMDILVKSGIEVIGIGKIHDIFAGRGVSRSIHTEGNADGIAKTIEEIAKPSGGKVTFIFTNLVDFDMLWGHRRDTAGYANGLKQFDDSLPEIKRTMRDGDLLIITADHGCDPALKSHTDHTREYVPLLVYSRLMESLNLGISTTFADVGATVADIYNVKGTGKGRTFI